MTEVELIDLFLATALSMDSNFQFWLSITFAILIATYLAGNNISRTLQWFGLVLYVSVSFLFIFRHMVIGQMLESIRAKIEATGSQIYMLSNSENIMIGYLYAFVLLGGTFSTIIYVIIGKFRKGGDA